jgi:L-alanine-DL-glutamate epimerase-like enolase superfamily enzyme
MGSSSSILRSCPPLHREGLAQVADALTVPIASGEIIFTHCHYRDLITRGRVDILLPDIVKVPGFTEFQRVAALAWE